MKKANFSFRINWEDEKIEIPQAFANAAQKPHSAAHKQLRDLLNENPGYTIVIWKREITSEKQTYKNLSFAEMRKHIIEKDGENSPNLIILDRAIADKVPYPKVKAWYLGIYGGDYARPDKVDTATPMAAVANSESAAAICA